MDNRKINLNNSPIRYRVKKYDTYQQRSVGVRRNMLEIRQAGTSIPQPTKSAIPSSNNGPVSSHSDAVITISPLTTAKSYKHQQGVQLRKVQKHPSPSQQNTQNRTNNVGLKAVAEAQIFDNEVYPDNEITVYGRSKRKLSLFQKSMYGFGVLVLVFSAVVSVQSFINNKQAKEQIATLGENVTKDEDGVSEGTGDEPSEAEISQVAISAFKVPNPQDPRFIRIPSIGVLARVKNLGTTSAGAVDAPKNIFDAGWYNGSTKPGSSRGSSLILGHVSGWTGPGIFKNITKLVAGSIVEIEKGNGEKIKYSVTKTEKLPVSQVDMSKILGTEVAGQHDIKLMTCSGKYNKDTKTFEDRFIVYASQVI